MKKMTVNRKEIMYRSATVDLKTRDESENEDPIIEGYFAVFNSETELWRGAYEVIAPGAFDDTLSNDIRALINHDTSLVLGRNKAGTLALRTDSRGLWGTVKINPDDPEAMALYSRVKRGDVDQCSFGFNVIEEETEWRDDDTVKWTINKADLHEVSVVTFPAYQDTSIQARHAEFDQMQERKQMQELQQRKSKIKERLTK
jgi:HK97 family phage prohead protease